MLDKVISWSLANRPAVLLATALVVVLGGASLARLPLDAFPDTTPVQVQVNTSAPALSPEEIERRITIPLEVEMAGLPKLAGVRSTSKFGLSQVVLDFEDGTDIYFARRLASERLASTRLPPGIDPPELGPVSTGLGEVFHYLVTAPGGDLTAARTLQDWTVKPALRAVPGVAEVNSWGGFERQVQVRVDPRGLLKHDLALDEVMRALEANNLTVGGGALSRAGGMTLVRGIGAVTSTAEIRAIVVTAKEGAPIRIGDVAEVAIGHEIRRGAVTADGRGEAVLGLGFMLMGENSRDVTRALSRRLDEVRASLPAGASVTALYDRTELVDHVIDTVQRNLFEGGLLVVAVLFAALGNLRAGLIVSLAIPLSMLFAFAGMVRLGIAGSLLSLGAIDFGLVVDSSVIMVENVVRRAAKEGSDRLALVRDAAIEVRGPTMFGEAIIMIVFLPILTLEGVEGKLFRPMAMTVILALAGSLVLSLTLMPVLASLLLPRRIAAHDPLPVRAARALYAPVLRAAVARPAHVVGLSLALLGLAGMTARGLGSEFVPRLSEGALVVSVVRLAGTDLSESVRYNTRMERALLDAFPDEVAHVWSRTGSAEVATDPMGVELTDVFLSLTPREGWRRAATQAELSALVARELRDMPGQRIAMSQPIEMRINEMASGARGDVAVKVFGDDFAVLEALARDVEGALRATPGCEEASTEQLTGQPVLEVTLRQDELARYGIPARSALDLVEALGNVRAGEVVLGEVRVPLTATLVEAARAGPEAIGALLVRAPSGERVPLVRLADLRTVERPSTITREAGRRRITVQCNVRGRDVGGFVEEARARVAASVRLPGERYRVEWGGQWEGLERARRRLTLVVPLALGMILALLSLSLGSLRLAMLVFTGVPLAATGGTAALWLAGLPFSISAAVGFVALSGVAVLNGLVMVTFIRGLRAGGAPLEEAVREGSLARLRPVLMTAAVAALGFLPMALAEGMGAEVQRPLATVVIGGIVSSTLLTLVVVPSLYGWFEPGSVLTEDPGSRRSPPSPPSPPRGDPREG